MAVCSAEKMFLLEESNQAPPKLVKLSDKVGWLEQVPPPPPPTTTTTTDLAFTRYCYY